MKVGIIGAGNIAKAYFTFLKHSGHSPQMWSPQGESRLIFQNVDHIRVSGALEGGFEPDFASDVAALADAEILIFAIPANGQRKAIDKLVPHLTEQHTVIFSGHLSFACLHLSRRLRERCLFIPQVSWNTTAMTCKSPEYPHIRIGAFRKNVDVAVIPVNARERALETCCTLFGPRFSLVEDLISIALTNLNPQIHLGMALCNLTRIELGETWHQNSNVTSAVGRMILALDKERLKIATAFGKKLPTVLQRTGETFETVHGMYRSQVSAGIDPVGPKQLKTRYVTEDVPFGLVATVWLADIAKVDVPLHKSGVEIINACYGGDFSRENDLLPVGEQWTPESLLELAAHGF